MNTADYERDAQVEPVSGATAELVEQRIAEFALPSPELYLVRG